MRFILKNKFGFSLVELLVVTAMLGIISLAIFATFNNGMKVWQRVNKHLAEEDVGIFFDKISRDLSNCLKSSAMPFSADQNNLKLPTQVYSPRLKSTSVGQVVYAYDSQSGALLRQQKDYSQIYSHQDDQPVPLLKNLRTFKLEYYFYDHQKQEYLWKEDWPGPGIPLAVRVSLDFNDSPGAEKIVRTISIPIGG